MHCSSGSTPSRDWPVPTLLGMQLELELLIPFLAAVLLGGFIGSRYGSVVAPESKVRRLLVLVLIVAATKRLFETFI